MKKVVLLLALCACTPQAPAPFGNTPAPVVPASTGKLLVAKPTQVSFALGGLIAPPQVVRLKSSAPLTRTLSACVADPTQVGVSVRRSTRLHDAKAVFYPISMGMHGGQTTVTITDISQPSITVKVPVSQQGCGRPDNLAHADLIYPPVGTKVATDAGALYFAVYSTVTITANSLVKLHLIVGKTRTLEGSSLTQAAPPPGAVIPTPPPGPLVTTYMRGSVLRLPRGKTIWTQVYDDSCQLPVLAGAFKTKL